MPSLSIIRAALSNFQGLGAISCFTLAASISRGDESLPPLPEPSSADVGEELPAPSALTPLTPEQELPNSLDTMEDPPPPETLLPPAITPTEPPESLLIDPLVEISNPLEPSYSGLNELTETPPEEHFFYRIHTKLTFDDNIFLSEDNTESDTLLRFRARAMWESGRRGRSTHWLSAYAEPSYVKFLDNDNLDSFDFRLGALYEFEKGETTINTNLTFDSNSNVDRFTSQRFEKDQTIFLTRAKHRWSNKSTLEIQLRFSHTANEQFSDVTDLGGRISTLYRITDKTDIGPFLGIKHSQSENNPSFYSIRGGAHLKYEATDKINLEAFAGIEYRDFESGRSSTHDPSFSLKAKYEKSDKLSQELTLAHRSFAAFNVNSAGYRATTLDYRAIFEVSSKIRINSNIGYEYDDYFETGLQDASLPTIHYLYAGLGLTYDWTPQHSASMNYRYRNSDSSEPNRDFSNHLLELNFSYQF